MVRHYKRKNEKTTDAQLRDALNLCRIQSLRQVEELTGIPKSTLAVAYKQFKNLLPLPPDTAIKPTHHHLQVLKPQHEQELAVYLIEAQVISHGLTPKQLRKLAYSFAKWNGIPTPPNWVKHETAGGDWFTMFMKRNKQISIRKPEATSTARAAALNPAVMEKFYDQIQALYDKYKFQPEDIYNTDETNNPTVVDPAKIIALKGMHQVCVNFHV